MSRPIFLGDGVADVGDEKGILVVVRLYERPVGWRHDLDLGKIIMKVAILPPHDFTLSSRRINKDSTCHVGRA